MVNSCPLCGGAIVKDAGTVPYDSIRAIYQRQFSIEIPVGEVEFLRYLECGSCGLLYFSPSIVGDGELYEKLQKFPWYYLADKSEFHVAASYVKDGDCVLEVGCGEGNFANYLPAQVNYTGIEYNDEAVKKAKGKGLNVSKISLSELAQENFDGFDIVCTFQVLEHVPEPGDFIAQMLRVLKPGGFLIIAVPSEDSFMRYEVNNVLNAPPHHQSRWPDSALRNVAELFNLDLIRIEHERLSSQHVPGFVKAKFFRALSNLVGMKFPMFAKWADRWVIRAAIYLLTKPLRIWYGFAPPMQAYGHTVTAIYMSRKA